MDGSKVEGSGGELDGLLDAGAMDDQSQDKFGVALEVAESQLLLVDDLDLLRLRGLFVGGDGEALVDNVSVSVTQLEFDRELLAVGVQVGG